jgi:hypothetical protein
MIFATACVGIIAPAVLARNVSYVGGWTFLEDLNDESAAGLLHYTLHKKCSLGYRYEFFRDEEWHYNGLQCNFLAKRWNMPDAQANIYVLNSAGVAASDYRELDSKWAPAFTSGMAADWENRRYFVSYENRYVYADEVQNFFSQKGRLGIAPYVAEFNNVHTWLMVEVGHSTAKSDEVSVTPLERVFKGPYMAEVGWNIQGNIMVNLRILF